MELFDIVDENGIPTGKTENRTIVHKIGARHRTAHVWIARKREGRIQILLQKRCEEKDSFPGCYDISSAGHIPAGVDYIPSALRELTEELGIMASEEELIDCGLHRIFIESCFHGMEFVDNQVSKVFLLWKDIEEADLKLQYEEIESVMWMDFEECKQAVLGHTIPHCIDIKELEILEAHF